MIVCKIGPVGFLGIVTANLDMSKYSSCVFVCVSSEKCVEVYLYQLHALLRADKYNVTLLSGKVRAVMWWCIYCVYTFILS